MTFYIRPREEWLDPAVPWDHTINGKGQYYICPPFRGWNSISEIVIHYPGSDWADMDLNNDGREDPNDTIALLRQGHKSYLMNASRGYSYGYGYKVGTSGDIWEIRGTDYTNAANAGDSAHNSVGWNNWSISIQIVVDEANPANSIQLQAVNWLIEYLVGQKGKTLNLVWHGFRQYTACAGEGIINQIKTGAIHLPLPESDIIDEEMQIIKIVADGDIFEGTLFGNEVVWYPNGYTRGALQNSGIKIAGEVIITDRLALQGLVYKGRQEPYYDPTYTGHRTTSSEFAGWLKV